MTNLGLVLVFNSALSLSTNIVGPVPGDAVEDICMKAQAVSQTSPAIKNQLLVQFDEKLSDAEIDEIVKRLGSIVVNRMSDGKLLLVEVPYPETLPQIQTAFEATPGVKFVELNQVYETQPNNGGTVEPEGIQIPKISN